MSQHPNDAAWRQARLHSLTNFGYLTVDSPVLDVTLDSWYFLPPGTIGRLRVQKPISTWLDLDVAQDLNDIIAQSVAAFRGFARLRECALSHRASPTSIQGWLSRIPIQSESHVADVALYIEQQGLRGQVVTGLFMDFDIQVACRSSRTHELGDYWLPGLHITLRPERQSPIVPQAEMSSTDTGITWRAACSSACASLFRCDNDIVLAQARAYWLALTSEEPEMVVTPGEDDDYQMLVTEIQPTAAGRTNKDLCAVNYPRLTAAISQWERAMSSAFEWDFET